MNSDIEMLMAIDRGYRQNRDLFKRLRFERIRESDIVRSGPVFDGALASAKFLGYKKPQTGLVELRKLLTKMNG